MSMPTLRPIGFIHTPFHQQSGTPIQPARAEGAEGLIDILPAFAEGLRDLDGWPEST